MNAVVGPAVTVLTPPECWQELRRSEVGRLAVAIAGHPDIFPINFVVDHASVVFRSAEGTKLAAAVLGQGVAFEADGYDPVLGEAWSVVVKGDAREIERTDELFDALDLPLFPWQAAPKHRFVRIVPREITGRRFRVVDPSRVGCPTGGEPSGDDRMSAVEQPRPAEMFELPRDLCRALLSTQIIGRLVLPGPEPYVVPVNFALVDGGIVFRSEPGPRVEALEGHRVAFEVDDHDVRTQSGWSVVVRGAAHEITLDVAEGSVGRWNEVRPWAPGDKACWIRIEIDALSGRLLRGAVLPTWVNQQAYL